MDSGNSGSLQSSSGAEEECCDSRAAVDDSSLITTHHQPPYNNHQNQNQINDTYSNPLLFSSSQQQQLDPVVLSDNHMFLSSPVQFSTSTATANAVPPPRNPKKRSRASRRAPTTVLTTDTSNFRAMVQEFTGIPSPPFTLPIPLPARFTSTSLDLFGTPNSALIRSSNSNYFAAAAADNHLPQLPSYLLPQFSISSSSIDHSCNLLNTMQNNADKFPSVPQLVYDHPENRVSSNGLTFGPTRIHEGRVTLPDLTRTNTEDPGNWEGAGSGDNYTMNGRLQNQR